MDLVDLMRAHLLADATIAGLVGTRIYPAPAPQAAVYPLLELQLVSDAQSPHLRQVGRGYARPRVQVDAWAETHLEAKALGLAVQDRLQGFVGSWVDASVSPATSHRVAVSYETGFDAHETDVATGGVWRRSGDYFLSHQGTAG